MQADLERRFGGLNRLWGQAKAERLRSAHVVVVGVGGVGSWVAEALARSGTGAVTLIDMDHIAESNINRQLHAVTPTLGMAKVHAMRERILLINPACRVVCLDEFVEPDTWSAMVPSDTDAVIDACDDLRAKITMAAWSKAWGGHFITVGAAGGKMHAHKVDIADLAQVTHDPLLAKLRYQLRKEHRFPAGGKTMRVSAVFSTESVRSPEQCETGSSIDGSLNCHGYGSFVSVTASFGMCAAGWVMNKITGAV